MTRLGEFPFWLVLAIVAAGAAGGVYLTVQLGWGAFWFAGLVPAAAVALLYLLDSSPPQAPAAPEGDEFDDPVAEAARLEAGAPATPQEPTPDSEGPSPGPIPIPDAVDPGAVDPRPRPG